MYNTNNDEGGQLLFDRARDEEKKGATDLIKKIKAMEISSNAKAHMIAKAQLECGGNGGGPAYKLGEAIFGNGRFTRLLRA